MSENNLNNDDSRQSESSRMPLKEAGRIVRDPSQHHVAILVASHSICDSPEATLDDLLACASVPNRSAVWRPIYLLHERTGVPKRFDEFGFIVIDVKFWRTYLSRLQPYPTKDIREV